MANSIYDDVLGTNVSTVPTIADLSAADKLFVQQARDAYKQFTANLVSARTETRGVQGYYPSLRNWNAYGQLSDWDFIKINDYKMPLHGMPGTSTGLDIDHQKAHGKHFFTQFISRGRKQEPTKFSLLLFYDTYTQTDYMQVYDLWVRDLLNPAGPDAKTGAWTAVEIYHPLLAAEGVTQIVVTDRPSPKPINRQMFSVDITAWDLRYAKNQKQSATKPVQGPQALKNYKTAFDPNNTISIDTSAKTSAGASYQPASPNPLYQTAAGSFENVNPGTLDPNAAQSVLPADILKNQP